MDWELISEQVLRHVGECVPVASSITAVASSNPAIPPGVEQPSQRALRTSDWPASKRSSRYDAPHQIPAPAVKSVIYGPQVAEGCCPATAQPTQAIPENCDFESRGFQRLDAVVDGLQKQQERNRTAMPSHSSLLCTSAAARKLRTVFPADSQRNAAVMTLQVSECPGAGQVSLRASNLHDFSDTCCYVQPPRRFDEALFTRALGVQKHEVGRGLAEVRAVLGRVEIMEERLSGHDSDLGHLNVGSSRAEGMRAALHGRQDHLDAQVCEVRDALAALDLRCMSAENIMHGAVSHGQAIELVRSIFGPFREQVGERLVRLENQHSSIRDSVRQTPDNALAELKLWVEGMLQAERLRRDVGETGLKQLVEALACSLKQIEPRRESDEAEVRKLNSTISCMEKRVTSARAEEASRIRSEAYDTEAALQRKIEELRTSSIRRIENACEEVRREREAGLDGRKEVFKEVSNVRANLLRAEQQLGGTNERVSCIEASMANITAVPPVTASAVTSIGIKVKELQVDIQSIRGATERIADQLTSGNLQAPGPLISPPRESMPAPGRSLSKKMPGANRGRASNVSTAQVPAPKTHVHVDPVSDQELPENVLALSLPAQEVQREQTAASRAETEESDRRAAGTDPLRINFERSAAKLENQDGRGTKSEMDSVGPCASSDGSKACGEPPDIDGGRSLSRRQPQLPRHNTDTLRKAALAEMRTPDVPSSAGAVLDHDPFPKEHELDAQNRPASQAPPSGGGSSSVPLSSLSSRCSPSPSFCSSQNGDVSVENTAMADSPPGALPVAAHAARSKVASAATTDVPSASTYQNAGSRAVDVITPPHSMALMAEGDTDSSFSADEVGTEAMSTRLPVGLGRESDDRETLRSTPMGATEKAGTSPPNPGDPKKTSSSVGSSSNTTASSNGEDKSANDAGVKDGREGVRKVAPPPPPPPRPPLPRPRVPDAEIETKKKSTQGGFRGPAPVSSRERAGSKDSGIATAQCEFCLRRYLRSAMSSHLQACELRLVRCPYQCGVKVLVRNLERHQETCSLKEPVEARPCVTCPERPTTPPIGPVTIPGDSKTHGYHPLSPRKSSCNVESSDAEQTGAQMEPSLGSGDANRTVTCMRCHESLPFHLVPSHGPKCKIPTTQAPAHFSGGEQTPPSSRNRSGVGGERESFSLVGQKRSPPLPSTGSFSSPVIGPGVWNAAPGKGVLTHGMSIPRSPPRPKDVRSWGTRQVTSWLRETMQPPKADIISRFHREAVDGAALLRLTDRDLLHPTEGMGITDAEVRRQILEALDTITG